MKTFGYDYSSAGILSSVKKYIVNWVNQTGIGQHKRPGFSGMNVSFY